MASVSLVLNLNALSQSKHIGKNNQINDKGQREGFWADSAKYRIRQAYYKNGMLSGLYKEYNKKGHLLVLGEYKDGQMCGTWFYFEDTGHLDMVFKDFSSNTHSIVNEGDGREYIPDYKCYFTSYYPNGNAKDEGILLWSKGEEPVSDFSVEYGEWKYYDDTGKLIKTKFFK